MLIVSTDPASNLDAVLDTRLGAHPRAVAGASGVEAMNIDPEQAALDYRERTVAPYRGVLPEQEVALLQERLRVHAPWKSLPSTSSRCCSAIPR